MAIDAELRALIHSKACELFPAVSPRLIEAVCLVESGGNIRARSEAGARGLMQVMPATAEQMGVDPRLLTDPAANLTAGIKYLRRQFGKFAEIGLHKERIRFALAAYNCGRGYVNEALELAREACGISASDLKHSALWQQWELAGAMLLSSRCKVDGKRPDADQVLLYVARVTATFWFLTCLDQGV